MRNLLVFAGIAAGTIGLALDAWSIFPVVMSESAANPVARSLPDAFIYFWTYFTHLTNLWLLATYVSVLTRWNGLGWFRQPVTMASAGAFIMLVMLYYHFMLAPYLHMEGALLGATILLHYVAPLLYLCWWALFAPHGTLRFNAIPIILLPGIGYVGWVLLRGAIVNEYPYDILDAGKFGYGAVAIGVLVLLVAVTVFAALLITADGWLARRREAA